MTTSLSVQDSLSVPASMAAARRGRSRSSRDCFTRRLAAAWVMPARSRSHEDEFW